MEGRPVYWAQQERASAWWRPGGLWSIWRQRPGIDRQPHRLGDRLRGASAHSVVDELNTLHGAAAGH